MNTENMKLVKVDPHDYIPLDVGTCCRCHKKSKLSDCYSWEDEESWELSYITYTHYECPHCSAELNNLEMSRLGFFRWEIDKFIWNLKKRLTKLR